MEENASPKNELFLESKTKENDSEEEICRFCHYDGKENKLYQPCKCSGSIRSIHSDCLTRWIKATGKDKCDLCKHSFSFTSSKKKKEIEFFYKKNFPNHFLKMK